MGKVHFKNNLMLITALLTALFLSSISTSVTRSLDGNDSSITSEAISPDGNSIAFGDNDAYMELDADWEELPDGLLTIELDSDSDGVRGSVEDCESEQGGVVNETSCEEPIESPANSIDDGLMTGGFVIFSCFLGLLFAGFILYTITKHDGAWFPLTLIFVILIALSIKGMPLSSMISDDSASFECPDGTIVTYGESIDFRDENGLNKEEFLDSPPPEWCDESLIWYEELTDQWFSLLVILWAGILSPVCLLILWRARTPIKLQNVKGQNSKTSNKPKHTKAKIDTDFIRQLIKKTPFDDDVAIQYRNARSVAMWPAKASSLNKAIRHERAEYDAWGWAYPSTYFEKTSKSSNKSQAANGKIDHDLVRELIKKYEHNDVVLTEYQKITSNRSNPPKLSSIENAIRHRRSQYNKFQKRTSNINQHIGKIDHELIKQLIKKYNLDVDVGIQYRKVRTLRGVKLSRLNKTIRHERDEYNKGQNRISKQKEKIIDESNIRLKQTLASQGSSKTWAREAASVKQRVANISNRMKAEKESELEKFFDMIGERYPEMVGKISEDKILQGLISAEKDEDYDWQAHFIESLFMNNVMFDLTSQYENWLNSEDTETFLPVLRDSSAKLGDKLPIEPMNLDTDILSSEESIISKSIVAEFSEDSNGIMIRRTSFSIVTINHISNRVEKVPTMESHNQMFRDEIKVMKNLEHKGIDVGLLDYDLGNHPKIVTRYLGSHKLGEAIITASPRGKKNLISGLIKQVGKIHKAGWIHRDLKPDNIMVDIRPRDGNHRFAAIIDYGIAMKINRKQMDIHNTAGTKFFGHSSQKETNFNASTGQDWFSLARIIALIIRGSSVESLNAEIQMSLTGLELSKEIRALGFESEVTDCLSELIEESTNTRCEDLETVNRLSLIGKQIENLF